MQAVDMPGAGRGGASGSRVSRIHRPRAMIEPVELMREQVSTGLSSPSGPPPSCSHGEGIAMNVPTDLPPSNAHRIWRLMNSLIEAHPEWADPAAFEAARAKMIRLGLQAGFSLDDLFAIDDPKTILSLWKAAEAVENDLWE